VKGLFTCFAGVLQQTLTSVRRTMDTVSRSALIHRARSAADAVKAISWKMTGNVVVQVGLYTSANANDDDKELAAAETASSNDI